MPQAETILLGTYGPDLPPLDTITERIGELVSHDQQVRVVLGRCVMTSASSADDQEADFRDFVNELAARRKAAKPKLTQSEVGRLIGTTQNTVADIENGETICRLAILIRYANVVGIDLQPVVSIPSADTATEAESHLVISQEAYRRRTPGIVELLHDDIIQLAEAAVPQIAIIQGTRVLQSENDIWDSPAEALYDIIDQLRIHRDRQGLSQAETAKRMRTGQGSVAELESGSVAPRLLTLMRYAAAVGGQIDLIAADPDPKIIQRTEPAPELLHAQTPRKRVPIPRITGDLSAIPADRLEALQLLLQDFGLDLRFRR